MIKKLKTIMFVIMALILTTSYASAKDEINVGVLITLSGPAGLFGPASENMAKLAQEQINDRGGVLGRKLKLHVVDVGVPPAQARQAALKAWKKDDIDIFVGMHDSAVRNALTGLFKGEVPYIYTATHSGGECSKGTYVLGETPQQQLEPVIPWLAKKENLKTWYLIGNDYIWPRKTNEVAKDFIKSSGGKVVGEEYIPLGEQNFDVNIQRIKKAKPDVVLITLVGGASVVFNRSFAQFGLDEDILRIGTLIEANTLAGIGPKNAKGIYSTSGYFSNIKSQASLQLKKDYYQKFGVDAPLMSALAESVYEGMLFLEAIVTKAESLNPDAIAKSAENVTYSGPRGELTMHKRHIDQNVYLAKASTTEAGAFNIVKQFNSVNSGATCSNL